jgi:atypical dual specificity phosphatase
VGISILLPGQLALGPWPDLSGLAHLERAGVTAVLSLQEPSEAPDPPATFRSRFRWARVPVADGHAGGTIRLSQLRRAVETIRCWREAGEMVYVHCYAGVGRAPTVCAAYLVAAEGLRLGEALARVKRARPLASPTAQQLLVLADFARQAQEEGGR